jgi:hypothetical protein
MSKFIDSPFEVCPVCDEYVFLDQSYEQCAREHGCGHGSCPLVRYFSGTEQTILKENDADSNSSPKL